MMTIKDILGQIGVGVATPIDRQNNHFSGHAHFSGPSSDGGYYGPPPEATYSHPTYAPPAYHSEPTYEYHVKHYENDSHKSNAAMSALTLLAFLFFLNILQQCLKEHMAAMTPPQIMIMTAGRESYKIGKDAQGDDKIDKIGTSDFENSTFSNFEQKVPHSNSMLKGEDNIEKVESMTSNIKTENEVPDTIRYDEAIESQMEKIYTKNKFRDGQPDYQYHKSMEDGFPGFVSAMTDEESYHQSRL